MSFLTQADADAHPSPTQSTLADRLTSLPAIFAHCAGFVAANCLVDAVAGDALQSLNGFQLLAWAAAISLVMRANWSETASIADMAIAFAFVALAATANATGDRLLFAAVATGAAIYAFARCGTRPQLMAAAAILLAVAGNAWWGPFVFSFVAEVFVKADVALVGETLRRFNPNVTLDAGFIVAPDRHALVILDRCSSFHNMTLAMLFWVSLTMYRRQYWLRGDFVALACACLVMFALNAWRIALMARSRIDFVYWHDGAGAAIFGAASTLLILAIVATGAVMAERSR